MTVSALLWAIPKSEDILHPTHEILNNTFTKYKIKLCNFYVSRDQL